MAIRYASPNKTTATRYKPIDGDVPSAPPTNFQRMRQWRREFAQTGRTQQAENALQTLAALYETDVSPRRAFWALRQVHFQVRAVLDEFHSMLREQSLPLPRRTQVTLKRYLAILEHLADCYFVVADRESIYRKPKPERIACALHASLELRREALLACTKVYTTPSSRFWSEVHAAYRAAERAGVAAKRVKAAGPDHGPRPHSPATAYRAILAFAVAQTENLPQSQVTSVSNALADWVTPDNVDRDRPSQDGHQPLVWVDLDCDQPPTLKIPPHSSRHMSELSDGERIMELTGVVTKLEALESSEGVEKTVLDRPYGLRPATVEHLLRRFRTTHVRQADRNSTMKSVDVKSGLDEIQSLLSYVVADDTNKFPAARAEVLHQSEITRLGLFQTVEHHTATVDTDPSSQLKDDTDNSRTLATPGRVRSPTDRGSSISSTAMSWTNTTPDWTLIDESADGLRLKWNANRPWRISVGQIIAYPTWADNGEASAWALASVRWIRCKGLRLFEFGAKKINGHPYPAVVHRQSRNDNRKQKHHYQSTDPALMVYVDKTDKFTVILPSYLYTSGQVVDIEMGEQTLQTELTAVCERTTNFTQFYLRTYLWERKHEITDPIEAITICDNCEES